MESKINAIKFLISDEVEALIGYKKKLPLFTPAEQKVILEIMADEADHIMKLKKIEGGE